jgi:holin-like protein
MIGAFLILLVCQVLGELAARLLGLPVPGPVIGTVLLLAVFMARGGPTEPVRDVARGLLLNLSLLFVPAGVGIMQYGERLMAEGLAIFTALIGSTILTIAVTAGVFRLVARLTEPSVPVPGDKP